MTASGELKADIFPVEGIPPHLSSPSQKTPTHTPRLLPDWNCSAHSAGPPPPGVQAFIAGLHNCLRLANIWQRHCHRRLGKHIPFALAPSNQSPRGGSARRRPHLHAACLGTMECLPRVQLANTLDPRTLIYAADWGPIQALSNRRKIKFHAILSSGVCLSRGHPACSACYKLHYVATGHGARGRD